MQLLQMLQATNSALHDVARVLMIRYRVMKQSNPVGALKRLQKQAFAAVGSARVHLTTAFRWSLIARQHAGKLFAKVTDAFVSSQVSQFERVKQWLQHDWLLTNLPDDSSLFKAVDKGIHSLLGSGAQHLLTVIMMYADAMRMCMQCETPCRISDW